MGKTKPNRHRPSQNGPTGRTNVDEPEPGMEEYQESPGSTVLTLIEKLQSAGADERECACSTISSLVCQPGSIPQFMKADLVKILGPLVVDDSQGVRVAALGGLRNLSVDGGSGVCEEMVRQDVMTPLITLLRKYSSDWTPATTANTSAVDLPAETLHQALHLLLNLCESSNVAVQIVNQQNIAAIVLPLFNSSKFGHRLATAAAQCLYTASEDNIELVSQLGNQEVMAALGNTLSHPDSSEENLYLRTLTAGVLVNLSGGRICNAEGAVVLPVVTVLSEALAQDIGHHLHTLVNLVESSKAKEATAELGKTVEAAGDQADMETDDHQSKSCRGNKVVDPVEFKHRELEAAVDHIQNLLGAQEISLELVANLCCQTTVEEEWEDCELSDTSSDDMATDPLEESAASASDLFSSLCAPDEIHAAFQSCDVVSKILPKMELPNAEICLQLNSQCATRKVVKSLQGIVQRALLCIGNLVSVLSVEDLGGPAALDAVWKTVFQQAVHPAAAEDVELLEAVTSSLRAVVDKLVQADSPALTKLTETDLELFYCSAQQCLIPDIRVNYIRILSCLCCYLVNKHQENFPQSVVKGAGVALLQMLQAEKELWMAAEILDVLMDIFADDCTDNVTRDIGLIPSLKTLLPQLKTKMAAERKHLGSHLPLVMTVKSNLIRFIKYKSDHGIT